MKFTIARRVVQLTILGLFIAGNIYGVNILKGNLSSSEFFGVIGLSDPYALLQLFLAGFSVGSASVIGALIMVVFYALIAPRAFCSWVCPVNILTDLGAYIRTKLKIGKNIINISSNSRYYLFVLSLIFSFIFSIAAFESISYIGAFTRGVVYLSGSAISIAIIIICIEAFLGKRLICGHLCPLGAFWALVSRFSLIRIYHNSKNCTHCNKCKVVCPEMQVLDIVGKQSGNIRSECISCGRCVEACDDDALNFSILKFRREQ